MTYNVFGGTLNLAQSILTVDMHSCLLRQSLEMCILLRLNRNIR